MAFGGGYTGPPGGQPPAMAPEARNAPQSGGFTEALKHPEVQAALLQFGINMLQPSYSGFGGQLAQSLGQAGAAAGRASAQKAERAEKAQESELRERTFGLNKRRVDIAEQAEKRRGSPGSSLQSMFTKPKSFQQFAFDMAKSISSDTFGERTVDEILSDPEFQQRAQQAWQTYSAMPGGGAGQQNIDPEAARQEARAAIARGAPPDAVKQRLQQLGIDTTGL